jgi:hypothetical protein
LEGKKVKKSEKVPLFCVRAGSARVRARGRGFWGFLRAGARGCGDSARGRARGRGFWRGGGFLGARVCAGNPGFRQESGIWPVLTRFDEIWDFLRIRGFLGGFFWRGGNFFGALEIFLRAVGIFSARWRFFCARGFLG